jgi:hypothetical protein
VASSFPTAIPRIVLLALIGVLGAGWALVHHYTTTLPPLRVPRAPSAAPTYDPDAGELPVPEFGEPERGR